MRLNLLPLLFLANLAVLPAWAGQHLPAVRTFQQQQMAMERMTRDQLIADNAVALVDDLKAPMLGNPRGDIWIVAFTDYNCAFCRAAEPRLQALLKSDPGVKLIVKEYPIIGPGSLVAARAALAAGRQGKYAALRDVLMAHRGVVDEAVVVGAAKNIGLDLARLKKDMAATDINDQIIANFNLARALRIYQTPGFIVEGHFVPREPDKIDFPALVAAARKDIAEYRNRSRK